MSELFPERRLEALTAHASKLGAGRPSLAVEARRALFQAALEVRLRDVPIAFTDAPVGTGKTSALVAYGLRVASKFKASKVIVALPYLRLCGQSSEAYRQWLHLEEESSTPLGHASSRGEHDSETRRWEQPVVVTTMAALLRRLSPRGNQEPLADAVVICDDFTQALPTYAVPWFWNQIYSLVEANTRFVLASATLPHYWQVPHFLDSYDKPIDWAVAAAPAISHLVEKRTILKEVNSLSFDSLAQSLRNTQAATLVVVNTVRTARNLAVFLGVALPDKTVRMISNGMTRIHRREAELLIESEVAAGKTDLVVVATSCAEAGWDISFAYAWRERAGLAPREQIRGRVNRHREFPTARPVTSFSFHDQRATALPGVAVAARLQESFSGKEDYSLTKEVELLLQEDKRVEDNRVRLNNAAAKKQWRIVERLAGGEYYPSKPVFVVSSMPPALQKALSEGVVTLEMLDYCVEISDKEIESGKVPVEQVLTKEGLAYSLLGDLYDGFGVNAITASD